MRKVNFIHDERNLSKLAQKGIDALILKEEFGDELPFALELWNAQGLTLRKKLGVYYLETALLEPRETTFCIVDIETNGSKPQTSQIIEIAAVKIKNFEVIDRFESLVHCEYINEIIVELTGITAESTQNAPSLDEIMQKFRVFLGDAVFVAHDVKFDYKFISQTLEKLHLEPLLNRQLCTISLAQRTISAYKYGLSYLNLLLNLHPNAIHHRAMSDVITTLELFKHTYSLIEKKFNSAEELIRFSKDEKMLKRPKSDPLAPKIEDAIQTQEL